MTILNLGRDASGRNTYLRQPSKVMKVVALVKDDIATLTIPSDFSKYEVIFSYNPGASVWVSINGTATYPTSDSFADTVSELNPTGYILNAGDIISVTTSDTADFVGVTIYASV